MEDGRALGGRGWYRHPLLSLLILSDHLPSTIALATPFYEETRRDNSRSTSPSRSLSFSLPDSSRSQASQRYEFLQFIAIRSLSLSLLLSHRTVSSIISHQRMGWEFHYRCRKERGSFPASNRSIYRSFGIFLLFEQITNRAQEWVDDEDAGRSPTVAGTTTQYQPPFHRIIYLAAGDSTPTTSCSNDRPRSFTFVRARLLVALSALLRPPRSRRSLQSAASRQSGRVVLVVAPSRPSPLLFPSSISCAKFGNVSRATSLNVSESFRTSKNNRWATFANDRW